MLAERKVRLEDLDGERGRIRTCDPCLKRALLYQLSYAPPGEVLLADESDSWNLVEHARSREVNAC